MGVRMTLHCDECKKQHTLSALWETPTHARDWARSEHWVIERGNYLCCPECAQNMKWCPRCRHGLRHRIVTNAGEFGWCAHCNEQKEIK